MCEKNIFLSLYIKVKDFYFPLRKVKKFDPTEHISVEAQLQAVFGPGYLQRWQRKLGLELEGEVGSSSSMANPCSFS